MGQRVWEQENGITAHTQAEYEVNEQTGRWKQKYLLPQNEKEI